jgi:hypothetical protein
MDELDDRCQWLSRAAELLADAQSVLDARKGEVAQGLSGLKLSHYLVKELMTGRVKDQARLHRLAERLNATIVHQIDSIRSILSFEKSLTQVTSQGNRT